MPMSDSIAPHVEITIDKIKHYLITFLGKTLDEADDDEFYTALSWALREEIMINWAATNHTVKKTKCRKLYYLSMEYMPGRLLGNNLTNICHVDLVKRVIKVIGKDYGSILKLEPEMGIGNGGLGRLASCFLDSLATKKYPAMGYGMRYQYGIFEQELWCGVQVERPDCWLLFNNPWSFRRDANAVTVHFGGEVILGKNREEEDIFHLKNYDEVRALPYDFPVVGYSKTHDFPVLTLRLWSTKESPRNFQLQKYNAGQLDEAAENTSLTDVLYPNDNNEMGKRVRLKQEFLLASASIQDIIKQHISIFGSIDEFADKVRIQINDTHPTLIIPELIRILMKTYDLSFDESLDITRTVCSYTNHTILKEALEEWNQTRMENLLPRQYKILQRIDQKLRKEVQAKYPNDKDKETRMSIIDHGQVKMGNLAVYATHKVNGVAKLHSEIVKSSLFRDFSQFFPQKFTNVTNGVTQRRWLLYCNPKLAEFLTKRIGDEWITNFQQIKNIEKFATDATAQKEFLAIKTENKKNLINFLKSERKRHACAEMDIANHSFLDETALFDVHIKRIHEYKRQLMNALHILMIYLDAKENHTQRLIPRLWIFGGKAAPGYEMAKNIIRFIYCLARTIAKDDAVNNQMRVVYVENYNVSKAEVIIPAADLSEQISCAGMEASGTGNMKLSINGALTIATDDGANVEMRESITSNWWPFLFGASAKENEEDRINHRYNPSAMCEQYPKMKRALQVLIDHSLVENEVEHQALESIYRSLMEGANWRSADYYFVLKDLMPYYEMQQKVEQLYIDHQKWAEYAIHNIAGMGPFSTDVSIQHYAEDIWELGPSELDMLQLKRIRKEFSEHDKCRIIGTEE
ncbi:MAG: glycogen/starch/alpha-glucan family phosphorylase [Chlamydiales bacterium]|nr:glycogen/starch/alpha-glucan family phosphorylase [Chlamydiales bacterium]